MCHVTTKPVGEPPVKRFRHLNKVLEQRWKEGLKQKSKHPPGHDEVEHYFDALESLSEDADPFDYWLSHQSTFPLLSAIAVDILSIPGSSAPVERVFSVAGESTTGRRNRLSEHNLEREVLLRKNKHFL